MTDSLRKDAKKFSQDINFFKNLLWLQNAQNINTGQNWVDDKGFVYSSEYAPPTKTDIVFLYYLMCMSQENDWAKSLILTHSDVLSACGVPSGEKSEARLRESLARWIRVTISFKGPFYDGINYSIIEFGIINSWGVIKGTNDIEIDFNASWLLKVKCTSFFSAFFKAEGI